MNKSQYLINLLEGYESSQVLEALKTSNDIESLIKEEFKKLSIIISKYPTVLNTLNLMFIEELVLDRLVTQSNGGTTRSHIPTSKFFKDIPEGNDPKQEMRIFKAKYKKWLKNLIVKLNGARRIMKWLDITGMIQPLLNIEDDR